mmetsp:Transcript_600/g.1277  ORF Transcript_600/g.1277 Transcript_600/m.1277 type:complete len:123 (-) Transcript_600:41-409(-)
MDELQTSDDLILDPQQHIEPILERVVDEVLKLESYDETLVAQWVDKICDRCMKDLAQLKKPYKYIVTCQIMQKTGAALHTGMSAFWNEEEDSVQQYVWPNEKKRDTNNSRMQCVLTAVGMAI